jgi:hypothetical protein
MLAVSHDSRILEVCMDRKVGPETRDNRHSDLSRLPNRVARKHFSLPAPRIARKSSAYGHIQAAF